MFQKWLFISTFISLFSFSPLTLDLLLTLILNNSICKLFSSATISSSAWHSWLIGSMRIDKVLLAVGITFTTSTIFRYLNRSWFSSLTFISCRFFLIFKFESCRSDSFILNKLRVFLHSPLLQNQVRRERFSNFTVSPYLNSKSLILLHWHLSFEVKRYYFWMKI